MKPKFETDVDLNDWNIPKAARLGAQVMLDEICGKNEHETDLWLMVGDQPDFLIRFSAAGDDIRFDHSLFELLAEVVDRGDQASEMIANLRTLADTVEEYVKQFGQLGESKDVVEMHMRMRSAASTVMGYEIQDPRLDDVTMMEMNDE